MLSLILAVVMLCSVFAAATSAFAANSGPYSYELINDGKEVKITAYNENKAILSIPSRIAGKPVTVIGSYAFSRIGRLQNVYLPLTVKTIEDHAFYESDRITFITIPSNVRVIGDYAFAGCGRLEWVSILTARSPSATTRSAAVAVWGALSCLGAFVRLATMRSADAAA